LSRNWLRLAHHGKMHAVLKCRWSHMGIFVQQTNLRRRVQLLACLNAVCWRQVFYWVKVR